MGLADEVGRKTAADVNQDVHSWMDDADSRIRRLITDLLSTLATAAVSALSEWGNRNK